MADYRIIVIVKMDGPPIEPLRDLVTALEATGGVIDVTNIQIRDPEVFSRFTDIEPIQP